MVLCLYHFIRGLPYMGVPPVSKFQWHFPQKPIFPSFLARNQQHLMNVGFTISCHKHQPSLNDWDPRGWPCWSLAPAGHGIQPRRSGPLAATHPHSGTGTSELKFTRKDVGFTIRMLLWWLFCGCRWCCRCCCCCCLFTA